MVAVDYVYQHIIVYGLDAEFIQEMQHIARVAMLPPDYPKNRA